MQDKVCCIARLFYCYRAMQRYKLWLCYKTKAVSTHRMRRTALYKQMKRPSQHSVMTGDAGTMLSVTTVLLQLLGEIDDLVFTRAKPQLFRNLDRVNAVTGFHALDKRRLAGIL